MTELRIIVAYKRYLLDLIETLEYIPKKEKYVKDLLLKNSFLLLEHIYESNLKVFSKERLKTELSLIDYYFEYLYQKKCLSHKIVLRKSNELIIIRKMIFSWCKNGN